MIDTHVLLVLALLVAVVVVLIFNAKKVFFFVLALLIVLLVYGVFAAVRDYGGNLSQVRGDLTATQQLHR